MFVHLVQHLAIVICLQKCGRERQPLAHLAFGDQVEQEYNQIIGVPRC
jgi:hypothetical protein